MQAESNATALSSSLSDLSDSEAPSLEALIADASGGGQGVQGHTEEGQATAGLTLTRFSTAELRGLLGTSEKKKTGTSSRLRQAQTSKGSCAPAAGLLLAYTGLTCCRGVTKHCVTGKYEAHLWDPEKKRPPVSLDVAQAGRDGKTYPVRVG